MKLQHLFESNTRDFDMMSDVEKRIFEWLLAEAYAFRSDAMAKSYKRTKISPIDWYIKNKAKINDSFSGYFDRFQINGSKVSHSEDVYLYEIDRVPVPEGIKFTKTRDFEISQKSTTIKEIPEWLPTECQNLCLFGTSITSLKGLDKIVKKCETLEFAKRYGPIKSKNKVEHLVTHLLTVFKINGFKKLTIQGMEKECAIINKHLTEGRDMLDCQGELIDAGFIECAKI